MYEDRFIPFIDVLGFGTLVKSSASDEIIQIKIYNALASIQSKKLNEDLYARFDEELMPPEKCEISDKNQSSHAPFRLSESIDWTK